MNPPLHVRIEPLDSRSLGFAVELLVSQLPAHSIELQKIGESPSDCYSHSLSKTSPDPVARAEAEAWAQKSRIDLDRLAYFVATEEVTGKRIGVSGIYSVLPGYLARETGGAVSEAIRFETSNVFWMGWTAVIDGMKGRGIGTQLMRHGVRLASEIVSRQGIENPHWAILADANAVGFYEKRGFTYVCAHGSGVIFADRLEVAAALVDSNFLKP